MKPERSEGRATGPTVEMNSELLSDWRSVSKISSLEVRLEV
jgi:hypothetical protein